MAHFSTHPADEQGQGRAAAAGVLRARWRTATATRAAPTPSGRSPSSTASCRATAASGTTRAAGRCGCCTASWAETRSLAAIREYIETYRDSRDHPALEDYLAIQRRHAADTTAFDAFAKQWFFTVVVPHYLIEDAKLEREGKGWRVTATVQQRRHGLDAVRRRRGAPASASPTREKKAKPWLERARAARAGRGRSAPA